MSRREHVPTDDDDGFCPMCGVTLDLHDGPDTCETAQMKAHVLDSFDRMVGRVVYGGVSS